MKPADPDAVMELVDLIIRTAADLTRTGDQVSTRHGQSAARTLVLGALDHAPDTIAGVARRRGLRRQSVQETMRRLEHDGLVRRDTTSNRRSPTFHLTPAGQEVRDVTHNAYAEWATDLAANLRPEDISTTIETLYSLTHETRDC